MKSAQWIFRASGIYGLIVLAPMYFLEGRIGQDLPPAITHPEFFYGFIGVALAWQVVFLIIGSDPVRFRPLMIPAMLEKITYVIAAIWLLKLGRIAPIIFAGAVGDFCWLLLFAWAFVKIPSRQ